MYVVHWLVAVLAVAPEEKRTVGNYVAAIVIGSTASALFTWAAVCVWRGRRLIGAVICSVVIVAGGMLSGVLAATSVWTTHPLFVILEFLIGAWGVLTLALLAKVSFKREAVGIE